MKVLQAGILMLALGLMLAAPAQAQIAEHKGEVYGGYSYTTQDVGLHGWNLEGTYLATPRFGVFGDVSGHYGGDVIGGIDIDSTIHHFLFGPRIYFVTEENFQPFGHILLGGSRISTESPALDLSEGAFTWGLGGGIDFGGPERAVGLRVKADYLRTNFFDTGANDLRFGAGVVFRFGAQ